jgi:hypothetical protein
MSKSGRIVPVVVLALSMAAVAWGHGSGHGRFRGPDGGHRGGGPDRLIERLIFPCRAGCLDASRTCFQTVGSTAETCVTGSCASEITAAQTACHAGRTSTCQTAVSALRTCAQSCTDTAATSLSTCHATLTSCLATCGES